MKEAPRGTRTSYRINAAKTNNVPNPSAITVRIPRKTGRNKDKSLNPMKHQDTIIEQNNDDKDVDDKDNGEVDAATKMNQEQISEPNQIQYCSSPTGNNIKVNIPVSETKSYPSL